MKLLGLYSSLLLFLPLSLKATDQVNMILVTTPMYHTMDHDAAVRYAHQAHVGWDIKNLYTSAFYYSTPHLVGKNEPAFKQDINLISVYKITIESKLLKGITTININTTQAKKPVTHPFKVVEVAKMAEKAVRLDYPDQSKFIIKINNKPIAQKLNAE